MWANLLYISALCFSAIDKSSSNPPKIYEAHYRIIFVVIILPLFLSK